MKKNYYNLKAIVILFALFTIQNSFGQSISVRVSSSSDDAEEKLSNGFVSLGSTDLELISDGGNDQTVGIRFNNITIPQGATINSASIQFETDEVDSSLTSITFYGEDTANAAGFVSVDYDISDRTKTTASINWNAVPSWEASNDDQITPDISSIIQEVVNRSDWVSGNSIAIIITGSGERTAESYDGESATAPLLDIDYTIPVGGYSCSGGILGNPEFEADLTSWSTTDSIRVTNDAYFGSKAIQQVNQIGGAYQNIAAVEGDIYALSVYAKKSTNASSSIGIKYFDASDNEVGQSFVSIDTDTYEQYTTSLVAPANTAYIQGLFWQNSSVGNTTVDGFCLEPFALTAPSCSNTSCTLSPSFNNYIWAFDEGIGVTEWKDYDNVDLILCDNQNGTLTLSGNIFNGRDSNWDPSTGYPCGAKDGWAITMTLFDKQTWAEFGGSYVQAAGLGANHGDWDYWDFTGTMTGIGCNAGRTISITEPSPGYRMQVGRGGNSQSTGYGLSAWYSADEGGNLLNGDIYAHIDSACYASISNYTPPATFSCEENLVYDGDFELDALMNWSDWGNNSVVNDALFGDSAIMVSNGAGGQGGFGQSVNAFSGATYTLTAYAKKTASELTYIQVVFYDENWQEVGSTQENITSSTYALYTITETAPSNTAYISAIGWKDWGTGSATFDAFCLTGVDIPEFTCSHGLLTNPQFEPDFNGWWTSANASISKASYFDVDAAKLSGTSEGGFGQMVPAIAGLEYTYSVYARKVGSGTYSNLGLKFFDANTNEISAIYVPLDSAEYKEYTLTAVAPASTAFVEVLAWQGLDASVISFYDGFCLTSNDTSLVEITNVVVSNCIDQPLKDVATVDVTLSWLANVFNTVEVNFGNKTEYIDISSETSPYTFQTIIEANGNAGNVMTASFMDGSIIDSATYDAPAPCSSSEIICDVLYLMGANKADDGEPFDYGFGAYLDDVNGNASVTIAYAKSDGSGYGLYDPYNRNNPLSIDLNDFGLVVISPSTNWLVAGDLVNDLTTFEGGILNLNRGMSDELGMTSGNAWVNVQDDAYIDDQNSIVIYNFDNINPTYDEIVSIGNYYNSTADAYLWDNQWNMSGGVNGIFFHYESSDVLPGIATHGPRTYLGYFMEGLYSNQQNGGVLPAPVENWFDPVIHLTPAGKEYFDNAILLAAQGCADANGCANSYDFAWSDGAGNGATWDLTNGEASFTRSYAVTGSKGGTLNIDVTLVNSTGSAVDQSNCGSNNFYLATCDANFAASSCGASYTNLGCDMLTFSKSTVTYQDNISLTYKFDADAKISDLVIGKIDFRSIGNTGMSYQDEISIIASLDGVQVPVEATNIGSKVLITGNQSTVLNIQARYQPATDGTLAVTDADGQVTIATMGEVDALTIIYKNGEADKDGISDAFAIGMTGFNACVGIPNELPVAIDDAFRIHHLDQLVGNVIEDDNGYGIDYKGDQPMTGCNLVSNTINGQLSLRRDGSFEYDAIPGYAGLDTFIYEIVDGNGDRDTAQVIILVMIDPDGDRKGENIDIDDDNDGMIDVLEVCGDPDIVYADLTIEVNTDFFPFELSWEIIGPDRNVISAGRYDKQNHQFTHTLSILYSGDYTFRMKDVFGDGMGVGSYVVRLNGTTLFSGGGNFGHTDIRRFEFDDIIFDCKTGDPSNDDDGDGIVNYKDEDYCTLNANGVCVDMDFDGDGVPDFIDLDADGEGIPDNIEAHTTIGYTPPTGNDIDGDGLDDAYDLENTGARRNGGSQGCIPVNTDGIDNLDYLDSDSDNDGISDVDEAGLSLSGIDFDQDGLDDAVDDNSLRRMDANGTINDPTTLPDEDGDVLSGGDVDFREFDASVLPVELTIFEVSPYLNGAMLKWVTESEINADVFVIERSENAIVWDRIGVVDGNGTTNVTQHYDYADRALKAGVIYYYRLKQVDFDGTYEYSEIRSIVIDATDQKSETFSMLPNVTNAAGQIRLTDVHYESFVVRISTIDGQDIMLQEFTDERIIDLSRLQIYAGVYLVEISDGESIQTQKLVIQ